MRITTPERFLFCISTKSILANYPFNARMFLSSKLNQLLLKFRTPGERSPTSAYKGGRPLLCPPHAGSCAQGRNEKPSVCQTQMFLRLQEKVCQSKCKRILKSEQNPKFCKCVLTGNHKHQLKKSLFIQHFCFQSDS